MSVAKWIRSLFCCCRAASKEKAPTDPEDHGATNEESESPYFGPKPAFLFPEDSKPTLPYHITTCPSAPHQETATIGGVLQVNDSIRGTRFLGLTVAKIFPSDTGSQSVSAKEPTSDKSQAPVGFVSNAEQLLEGSPGWALIDLVHEADRPNYVSFKGKNSVLNTIANPITENTPIDRDMWIVKRLEEETPGGLTRLVKVIGTATPSGSYYNACVEAGLCKCDALFAALPLLNVRS
jgi:hypothetical protein